MISIQILEPKHVSNPKNAFIATCEAMVGDGDEFYTLKLALIHKTSGYENELEELVTLLQAMDTFRWKDDASYADLENYDKWFPSELNDGYDAFEHNGFIATLYSFEITYYDNDGVEHSVSIDRE